MEPAGFEPPYCVPESELPCPLPTQQEIEDEEVVIVFQESSRVRVVFNGSYVIKYGPGVDVMEAINMNFMREKTTIPVPKVYAVFESEDNLGESSYFSDTEEIRTYIVMEELGRNYDNLEKVWESLNAKQKAAIMAKLRDYMDQLRSLPGEYYGSAGHNNLRDSTIFRGPGGDILTNWYAFEHEFNYALLDRIRKKRNSATEFCLQAIPVVFRNHKPVFTHNQFQRKHIRIKKNPATKSEEETFDLCIIDWNEAGWYPDYWEYSMAMVANSKSNSKDDWHLWLDLCLDPYYTEYAWIALIDQAR